MKYHHNLSIESRRDNCFSQSIKPCANIWRLNEILTILRLNAEKKQKSPHSHTHMREDTEKYVGAHTHRVYKVFARATTKQLHNNVHIYSISRLYCIAYCLVGWHFAERAIAWAPTRHLSIRIVFGTASILKSSIPHCKPFESRAPYVSKARLRGKCPRFP